MSEDKKFANYKKWVDEQYITLMGLSQLREYAVKDKIPWLNAAITEFDPSRGNIWRFDAFINLSYLLPIKKYEYITTVLSVSRQKSFPSSFRKVQGKQKVQFHTNYAFIYASRYAKPKSGKLFHFEYMSLGNTYKSADGEYRGQFFPVAQFNSVYTKWIGIITPYEEYISRKAKKGEFTLKSSVHFPMESASDAFYAELDDTRLIMKIYVIVFIVSSLRKRDGLQPRHINDGFAEAVVGDDISEFEKIFITQDERDARVLSAQMSYLLSKDDTLTLTVCGQKIIPLRTKEVEDLQNIRYNVWREIYIGSIVGDLVLNNISPSFPLFKDYTMLYSDPENSKELYDNIINHIKIDHSVTAGKIVRDLEDVRRQTFILDPIKKKELYISYRFEGLSDTIEIPMDYAEKNIIMSNYAVCLLNEHLGTTFGDLPNIMRVQMIRWRMGPMFSNVFYFAKYMFECLYGLYSMNYHLGFIHSDLHVNNATTFDKKLLVNMRTGELHPNVKNPHIIYNVHGEHYVFPHLGRYASIIDFSRAVIDEKHLTSHFPKKVARDILTKEKKYIISRYQQLLPDFFRDNESSLRAAVEDLFPVVFKLFSAIDAFVFSQGMKHLIETQVLGDPENMKLYGDRVVIEEHIIPLLTKIHEIAFEQLTTSMFKVITRKIISVDDLEWPNAIIIRECYKYARVGTYNPLENPIGTGTDVDTGTGTDAITLIDYFNIDNELKYNTRNYEDFPPMCKLDEAIKRELSVADVLAQKWKEHQEYLKDETLEDKTEKIKEHEVQESKERRGVQTEVTKKDIERAKHDPAFSSEEFYYET